MHIDPTDPTPIWVQIEDQIRQLVGVGALPRGAAAPSVRELARALRVNPATVSKAYQRLCQQGVLEVRRGEGTFVALHPPRLEEGQRGQVLATAARRYAVAAIAVGASHGQAQEALRQAWPAATDDPEERP
jgi:GntR family transcriptional regulator